jgi:polyribonucleotide nucleotidyltransferase
MSCFILMQVPTRCTIGAVEVALIEDSGAIINPTNEEASRANLVCTVAGNRNGIVMLDGYGKAVPEDRVIEALGKAQVCRTVEYYVAASLLKSVQEAIIQICDGIEALKSSVSKPKMQFISSAISLNDLSDQIYAVSDNININVLSNRRTL